MMVMILSALTMLLLSEKKLLMAVKLSISGMIGIMLMTLMVLMLLVLNVLK